MNCPGYLSYIIKSSPAVEEIVTTIFAATMSINNALYVNQWSHANETGSYTVA